MPVSVSAINVGAIVACFDDPSDLIPTTERIFNAVDLLQNVRWSLIVYSDGPAERLELAAAVARSPFSEQVSLAPDRESAWRLALEANPDVIVNLAAGSDSPEGITDLLDVLERTPADIAVGTGDSPPRIRGLNGLLVSMATGGVVRDLTSTFWACRAEAARAVSPHRLKSLASVLAEATRAGLDVTETPVVRSTPSVPLPRGSGWSLLFEGVRSRSGVLAILIVLTGLCVFGVLSYPAHQYLGDSDSVISGLCAVDVLNGTHWLFFPSGYRLGPHSCYVGAVWVAIMGQTREALAAITMVYIVVFLTFVFLALRVALGRKAALTGTLAAAFPPLQYVLFIEPPWGYGEIMACTAITLWFGFVLLFRPVLRSKRMSLLFGLTFGLTIWTSPQSLMVTGPLILLLLVRRVFPSLWDLALLTVGTVAGLWAYLVTILQKGTAPFASSFATRPVDSIGQLTANIHYLSTHVLPLFFLNSGLPPQTPAQGFMFLVLVAAAGVTAWIAWKGLWQWERPGFRMRNGLLACFTIAVIATSVVLFVISGAGSIRGWTTRYLAPLFFVVPLLAANLCQMAIRRRVGSIVVIAVVALSTFNGLTYRYPNNQYRVEQTLALATDRKDYDWLVSRSRAVVLGEFWAVYRLNFGFGTSLTAVPTTLIDYNFRGERLLSRSDFRLALIHTSAPSLQIWAGRAGLRGHIESMPGGQFAFLVDGEVEPRRIREIISNYQ